jgi:DNA-binding MarR family transcriptional regulator
VTGSLYQDGALQVKAYRLLQAQVYGFLEDFGLNPTQWFVLGYIQEHKKGVRLTEIAELLSVETPLITMLADKLEEQGLLKRTAHPTDGRAKLLVLTKKGGNLLPKVEQKVRAGLNEVLMGVNESELATYHKVLRTIIANTQRFNR